MNVFGVRIDALNAEAAAEIAVTKKGGSIYTPNAVMLDRARRNKKFRDILNSSFMNLPDGAGTVVAVRMICKQKIQRTSGVDFGYSLMARCEKERMKIFLFGGKDGVAREAVRKLKVLFPKLIICGISDGYGYSADIARNIRKSGADFAFVCLGSPLQEVWIHENMKYAPECVFVGLGGSLDIYSGNVKRAPLFFRKTGTEWAYRMATQPKRLRNLPCLLSFFFHTVSDSVKKIFSMGNMIFKQSKN